MQSQRGKSTIKILLTVLIATLIVCLGVTAYLYISRNGNISASSDPNDNIENLAFIEGIRVDDIDISGMTMEQAMSVVSQAQSEKSKSMAMELYIDDQKINLPINELQPTYDTEAVLTQAIAKGHTGTKQEQQAERELIAEQGAAFTTKMSIDVSALQTRLDELAQPLNVEPVNAQATFDKELPERFAYTPEVAGRNVDTHSLVMLVQQKIDKNDYSPAEIPYEPVEPEFTVEELKTQVVMVASHTTSYKKSPYNNSNRVFNIKREAEIINGTVLMPDEIFDINAILGPRTSATGWKDANGIRGGRYELEPGGGVCQGSSTLYNAVAMADLEIVERKPHSWPLSYVPIGRDATISTGGPNFRFKNNRTAPIYVVAYTNDKDMTVTYEIWGEPLPDGITQIKLVSKKTETIPSGGMEYQIDPTLAPGTQVVHIEERKGAVAETYKEYYKGTELVKRVLFTKDRYRAFTGLTYISADLATPAEPVSVDPAAIPVE